MRRIAAFSWIIIFLLPMLALPIMAAAQTDYPEVNQVIETIFVFIFGRDFDRSNMTWDGIVQFIILPFVACFAVFYGILAELRIFRTSSGKKAMLVISVVMALVAGSAVLSTMRWFLVANSWVATAAFGTLLMLGIILWWISGAATGYYVIRNDARAHALALRREEIVLEQDILRMKHQAELLRYDHPEESAKLEKRVEDLEIQLKKKFEEEEKKQKESRDGDKAQKFSEPWVV